MLVRVRCPPSLADSFAPHLPDVGVDCSAGLSCGIVVLLIMAGCRLFHSLMVIIIIIRQPLGPVVGRRPQHAVSKLPCLVLSSAISCRSSICLDQSYLHRLAGLPCRLFVSCGLQVVTREVHRSSLRRLICPAHDHFIFLTVLIISMTFVLSLTQMLVFLSLYVMLSIKWKEVYIYYTSFHFGLMVLWEER